MITRIDPKSGVLFFADGSQARGHIIIGADGVHSVCRSFVPNGNAQRFRIQRGVFRAVIPREKLLDDPKVSSFIHGLGQAFCYNLGDKSVLIWPASEHEAICIKFLYQDLTGFKSLCKDWREPSSKMKLLRLARGFPEECMALLDKIESGALQDQPIWDMDPLNNYHFQRLVLMGDAAHPMPPYCGQRVAMALEDAVALGVLLERNVSPAEIEDRFKLYSGTRASRSAAVQQFVRGLSEADIWGGASGFDGISSPIFDRFQGIITNSVPRERLPHIYPRPRRAPAHVADFGHLEDAAGLSTRSVREAAHIPTRHTRAAAMPAWRSQPDW